MTEIAGTAAERPRLYHVAPAGLSLAERAAARQGADGRRVTWAFAGYDEATAKRAGFNCGLAYSWWGVEPLIADRLGSLAYHLTQHTLRVINTPRCIVTAALVADVATVSVLARLGRAAAETDPGTSPEIRELAQKWGRRRLAAGPCLYAAIAL